VALKVINKEHLARTRAIQRFYREIQAAAHLSHRNIVLAYDAGEVDGTHFFAMEYVEGKDLNQLVRHRGPLPVRVACSYLNQAALGLQHAHEQGLVHRDIKPSNLFATWNDRPSSSGQTLRVHDQESLNAATIKILDFGLALLFESDDPSEAAAGLTRDGRVVGTADYMAPEQWMNARKVDIRADLYSLGGTFYYLLTGQVPFPAEETMEKMLKHHLDEPIPVDKLRPETPPAVIAVLRRLMAKKPDHRFQQPREVSEALKSFLPG
jgi:serine/threonine-protein kinase